MQKALHLKFEKAIILTFVNPSLVFIPGWIEQKKLLILGFGIFGIVHSRPRYGHLKIDFHLLSISTFNGHSLTPLLAVDLGPLSRDGADQTIDFRL